MIHRYKTDPAFEDEVKAWLQDMCDRINAERKIGKDEKDILKKDSDNQKDPSTAD